jgi:hypothetical protein
MTYEKGKEIFYPVVSPKNITIKNFLLDFRNCNEMKYSSNIRLFIDFNFKKCNVSRLEYHSNLFFLF